MSAEILMGELQFPEYISCIESHLRVEDSKKQKTKTSFGCDGKKKN